MLGLPFTQLLSGVSFTQDAVWVHPYTPPPPRRPPTFWQCWAAENPNSPTFVTCDNFLLSCFRGHALASLLSRFLMNQAIHKTSEEGGTCTWHSFITLFQNSAGLFACILLGFQLNCCFKYISFKSVWEIAPKKKYVHQWNKKKPLLTTFYHNKNLGSE